MKYVIILVFTLSLLQVNAQSNDRRSEVEATIQTLFEGMRNADSSAVRSVFHPEMRLQTTYEDQEGVPQIVMADIDRFIQNVGQSEKGMLNEVIWSYDVQIDQNLASVWTPYTFFRGDQISHCGVNAFQLFRGAEGWQIIQITDTRQREGCQKAEGDLQKELDRYIDEWHRAAAEADEDAFFGAMSEDGVYIGTDKSERWLRDELREWAQEAFARESAWVFTPIDRVITVGLDGRTAWWDETLDTWMGVCRSTGILYKTESGWKIKHYQLSVTVPNGKIEDFKKLVKE